MRSLNKVSRITVRLTPDQERRTEAAAAIVSRQKGESVKPSTLLRELAMPHIDQIVADNGRAGDQAA
jgi:hypothetical protein